MASERIEIKIAELADDRSRKKLVAVACEEFQLVNYGNL